MDFSEALRKLKTEMPVSEGAKRMLKAMAG